MLPCDASQRYEPQPQDHYRYTVRILSLLALLAQVISLGTVMLILELWPQHYSGVFAQR